MSKVAVVGSYVADLMARTPHLPEPGETVKGTMFRMGAGGKGFNQAVAAAKAGADIRFSTKIGKDAFGQMAVDMLKEQNISQKFVFVSPDTGSGIALISVDENTCQNEIIVVPGACDTFGKAELAELGELLDGVSYLLLQLEINLDAVEQLVTMAAEKGIKVILNPAPVQNVDSALYSKLFLITPNEVEAGLLTGLPCKCDTDFRLIARYFMKLGTKNVIITLGKRGVYLCTEDGEAFFDNYDVPVIDTTGAGDAFNGGLLAALGEDRSLCEACRFAQVVSNLSVTKLGTSSAMPLKNEILAFVKNLDKK